MGSRCRRAGQAHQLQHIGNTVFNLPWPGAHGAHGQAEVFSHGLARNKPEILKDHADGAAHLPPAGLCAVARAERLYRSAGHLGDQSGVFLREPPLSACARLARTARKAGHGSLLRDARHQCTSCAYHGARRILRPFFGFGKACENRRTIQ